MLSSADDEHADNPLLWRGLNLLGFALMDVRERLAKSTGLVSFGETFSVASAG